MMNWNTPIMVSVVAGLFALLGAFAGAWLTRRTEYDKWLRQNRSEVYTRFLDLLGKAHKEATDIMFDRTLEELPQSIRVTETYLPPMDYVRVVRLYLSPSQRQIFAGLAHEYFVLHSQKSLGDSRLNTMGKKLDEIQKLFESTL